LLIVIGTCNSCLNTSDEEPKTEEELRESKQKVSLKTNISFRYITKAETIRENVALSDGNRPVFLNRSYAYFISNFDKTNPDCWSDLETLGKSIATPEPPYELNNSLVIVNFLADTKDTTFRPIMDPLSPWEIYWPESGDSLFIANYLYGIYGDKLVRHWK